MLWPEAFFFLRVSVLVGSLGPVEALGKLHPKGFSTGHYQGRGVAYQGYGTQPHERCQMKRKSFGHAH